ncbi:MAG: energy transducer TonB [Acidobacteriia bacterium]|nr:energy transducer TonB [Terriglobia bacterium]
MEETLELRLLLEPHRQLVQPPRWQGFAGAVLIHLLLAALVTVAPPSVSTYSKAPLVRADLGSATALIAPPAQLTQKRPGKGKPSTEVNLEGLLSTPSVVQPPPAPVPGTTRPAAPRTVEAPPSLVAPAPKPVMEPPKIEVARNEAGVPDRALPPGLGNPDVPAQPQIQTQERPKIAFERPGANMGLPSGAGTGAARIPAPSKPSSVMDTGRQIARSGGGGGLTVGDIGEGIGGLGGALNQPASPPKQGSSLELMSDPMGVDFKPYLIRILSTVRRNWFAVIPESVRLGRRGRVQIQFAIDKNGSVPKLVIALPSGTESLDRAAVAGVSASNPFPPLPDEFKGQQIRLQFTFSYNMPSR